MKHLLALLAIGFISYSFILSGNFEDGYFKTGELIVFSGEAAPKNKIINSTIQRGSYDGTSFDLNIDSNTNYLLSKLRPAMGDKQDELMLVGCNGTGIYDGNIMTIELQNNGKKYFMVDINTGAITKLNFGPKRIFLESQDLKGNKAAFYSPEKANESITLSLSILALPLNVKRKALYAAVHDSKTIAHFKSIIIECDDNEKITFPSGCYMLCAGNSFMVK
jgi:hypothetical protein